MTHVADITPTSATRRSRGKRRRGAPEPTYQARPRPEFLTALVILTCFAVVGLAATQFPMPLVAVAAMPAALIACAVSSRIGFALVLVASPLIYDLGIGPVKLTLGDLMLVLFAPFALFRAKSAPGPRIGANPLLLPIGAYLCVCAFSTIFAGDLATAVRSIVQMLVYVGVAVLVFAHGVVKPTHVTRAFGALMAFDLLLAVMVATGTHAVLGLHKNAIGTFLAFGFTIAFNFWLHADPRDKRLLTVCLGVIAVGLFFSLSRGAWAGSVLGACVALTLTRRLDLVIKLALVAVPILAVCWTFLPEDLQTYAAGSVDTKSHSFNSRQLMIKATWELFISSPIIGVGVGVRKLLDATNLIMFTLAETGIIGLLTFGSVFVVLGRVAVRAARRLEPGDPRLLLVTLGAGLMTCKLVHGLVDHYWGAGLAPVWAGAGLVVYAASLARTPLMTHSLANSSASSMPI